ncbi:alpha/beta fold hydrolase [Amycolatopsis sp. DSM 110486]|uniref:alpha/beta fold hydrolase n=1 Tax=Amycolatopsis sp. DSM 110486 TaxID=2865832 RepID=UPI001C69C88F|nr:alpha/beta fold hydrolase [Amycolatopsis sp. DSM 110486]QYN22041.1 alpha/beta hydrolase [Amycolatopsis sp. DSM 110486]
MPTIDVNGTSLAYTAAGPESGTAVVLSHSLFFDRTMFAPLVEILAGEGFRTVAYDHRNQGGSAPDRRDRLDMDTLAADAAALIEALGLGPCHFVGNSMGGFVALRLAARRPDLLLTAAALGSSAEAENRLEEYQQLSGVVEAHGPGVIIDVLLRVMFGATSLTSRPQLCDPWRTFMAQLPPAIAESVHGVIHRTGIEAELAGCATPVLAVAGSEDETYPQPISGRTIAEASGGQYVVVAAAGHSVALEQPERVAEQLLGHFATVRR